ncbi:hypothetical protein OSB04_012908 [Centaurea solstitialis]|uniref:Uncharacterized protein n=1 Tax=Centaurea solstitialis TaxID=347529 RepID=A0AA38TDZ2_9ASTR|nr:hypothetical protein OSB04_012908 [Centaurea solstitialis]
MTQMVVSKGSFTPHTQCSPRVSSNTKATLTEVMVVAHQSATTNTIPINGDGRSVKAIVVDECDSTMGCDEDHDYQPPCPNNIVDASKVVWKALGVSEDNWGDLDITWSDA